MTLLIIQTVLGTSIFQRRHTNMQLQEYTSVKKIEVMMAEFHFAALTPRS